MQVPSGKEKRMINDNIVSYIMEHIDDECKTFRNAVCESLENNDSGSGLAYNITQFKCGSADCAVSMNFIGHWDDDEVNGK